MILEYKGYMLKAVPVKTHNGRWSVAVKISSLDDGSVAEKSFFADDKIWYVLKEEAEKESLNLGRNLINRKMIGI